MLINNNRIEWTDTGKFKRSPEEFDFMKKFIGLGLEIGCGNNRISPEILAFDISDKSEADMIFDCQNKLPFQGQTFDFIVSSYCIKDFENPTDILRDWARILKFDGWLILILPDMDKNKEEILKEDWKQYSKWWCSPKIIIDMIDTIKSLSRYDYFHWENTFVIISQKINSPGKVGAWCYTEFGIGFIGKERKGEFEVEFQNGDKKWILSRDLKCEQNSKFKDFQEVI